MFEFIDRSSFQTLQNSSNITRSGTETYIPRIRWCSFVRLYYFSIAILWFELTCWRLCFFESGSRNFFPRQISGTSWFMSDLLVISVRFSLFICKRCLFLHSKALYSCCSNFGQAGRICPVTWSCSWHSIGLINEELASIDRFTVISWRLHENILVWFVSNYDFRRSPFDSWHW